MSASWPPRGDVGRKTCLTIVEGNPLLQKKIPYYRRKPNSRSIEGNPLLWGRLAVRLAALLGQEALEA